MDEAQNGAGQPVDDRRAALGALAELSGISFSSLDELFPTQPWADVVPDQLWYRRDVLEQQDPRQRYLLHQALERLLVSMHAATIMTYLPPVPWSVLAPYGVHPPMRVAF